jgi:hypothetical protein
MLRILTILMALALVSAPAPPAESGPAQAFARIKALEGEWEGKSTKGWVERVTFEVIAGGTCVVERSLDAHPGETMLTVYHMDGERLMLTHYCVAKNQPRLEATVISPDLKTVGFTFRDATSLASRDVGHMDEAVYRFVDDDHFTARWSWYQAGATQWMEEIAYVRRPR